MANSLAIETQDLKKYYGEIHSSSAMIGEAFLGAGFFGAAFFFATSFFAIFYSPL
jgi:hypothetical protein